MQTGEIGQSIGGFGGVNLRVSRTALKDGDLARVVNADLHQQYGVAKLRAGLALLSATLSGLRIQRLARINGVRYQLADNLYRNYTSVYTSLTTDKGTLVPFRPLNDTALWCFAAGQTAMRKDDGTNTYRWGIVGPSVNPTTAYTYTYTSAGDLANPLTGNGWKFTYLSTTNYDCCFSWEKELLNGSTAPFSNSTMRDTSFVLTSGITGNLNGAYSIRYTFIRKVGAVVACESNPSPVSNTITVTASTLLINALEVSSDPQVTHVRIYRTTANGAVYLFDQDVVNGTLSAESTQADTALADLLETDNDIPPVAYYAFAHLETMFLLGDASNPHYLWFSKRFRPEQVPPDNYLEIGSPDDPLLCGGSIAGVAGVFTSRTKYKILGNSTSSFVAQESLSRRGIKAPNSLAFGEMGAVFMASDGIYVTNFSGPDESIGEVLEPLFYGATVNGYDGFNWDVKELFAGEIWKNRYYLSVATGSNTTPDLLLVFSFDTKKWYWYDHTVTALNYEPDTELITAGLVDGSVVSLESGTTDDGADIALEIETGDIVGQEGSQVHKLWLDATVEADTAGEDVTLKVYVDDTLKTTQTLTTGSRTTKRFRLPGGCMGQRCRMKLTYTGSEAVAFYGGAAYYLPLNAV